MKFPTKRIFRIFPILRINGMAPFCNLFMERPSYINIKDMHSSSQQATTATTTITMTLTMTTTTIDKSSSEKRYKFGLQFSRPIFFLRDCVFTNTWLDNDNVYRQCYINSTELTMGIKMATVAGRKSALEHRLLKIDLQLRLP